MSYTDFEVSQASAKPVEAYKLIGTSQSYHYTSADVNVTIGGQLYEALPIRREEIRPATQEDAQLSLEVTLPISADVVTDYAFTSAPPALALEIWRIHWGMNFAADAVKVFSGAVMGFSIDGVHAKLRIASVFTSVLASPIPPRIWQKPCNHVLYDARCAVVPTSFTATATVAVVEGQDITVDNDGFADAYLRAGEMITSRSNERRMIVTNASNLVTVNYPFHDLVAGDTVTLRAGCDHSFDVCRTKFNNVINFGGHPYIPDDNPFQGEVG